MISEIVTDDEYLQFLHKQNDNIDIFDEIKPNFSIEDVDKLIEKHFQMEKLFQNNDDKVLYQRELNKQMELSLEAESLGLHFDTSRMNYTTVLDTIFSLPKKGTVLMRGRKHNYHSFSSNFIGIQDAYLNLSKNINSWGRLNCPHEQILYLSSASKTIESELKLKPEDCYDIFFYSTDGPLKLVNLITEDVYGKNKPKSTAYINTCLQKILTKRIKSSESYKYAISREISHKWFNVNGVDGWSYPSVADDRHAENIALLPSCLNKVLLIGSISVYINSSNRSIPYGFSAYNKGRVIHSQNLSEMRKIKPELYKMFCLGNKQL